MDAKSFLNKVCEEIKYKSVREEISEELEQHINDLKEEYIINGIQEKEAEEKAVLQMGDAKQIGNKLNKIHKPRLDWKLTILIVLLTCLGLIISIIKRNSINSAPLSIGNVLVYILLGTILSVGIYLFDYRKIKNYPMHLYIIATVLMILPLTKLGVKINGVDHIRIFGITFTPSTVTLPLYLISFISFLFTKKVSNIYKIQFGSKDIKINKKIIKIITLTVISLLLMFANNSVSNMIILSITYLIIGTLKILKYKEPRIKRLIILYGTMFVLIALFAVHGILSSSYRFDRITYLFNPQLDQQGNRYVRIVQKEMLQNIKLVGEVENTSIQIDESILKTENSYTYIYIMAKCGMLFAAIITIAIFLTSIHLIIIARNIKEEYGKFLIIGLGLTFILQSLLTIFMNINIGITVDVNLPFVTYGAVYFIINIMSFAIILSVYRRKDIYMFEKNSSNEEVKV